ncbi:hypothetical protein Tco_0169488 [Tanacetum coccineum]
MSDESHVISLEELRVDDKLHFVEESIEVIDHKIKQLKRSRIPIIKVRWNSKRGPEFTWEREDQFKQKYPHLFTKTAPSSIYYESDHRVPLILGRPFLRTARALIDVHGEEMILRDDNERLILNMRHDTSSYSTQPHQESINMIDVYNVSHEEILEDLFATNHPSGNPTLISEPVTKSSSSSPTLTSIEESDLIWEEFEAHLANDSFPSGNSNPSSPLPPFHNSLSGSTTSSSPSLPISKTSDYSLEEFADELAHFTFPLEIDYLHMYLSRLHEMPTLELQGN